MDKVKMKEYSRQLNQSLPKSEVWFHNKLKETCFPFRVGRTKKGVTTDIEFMHNNKPFQNTFIPDVVCHKYKFVIEVDGSIHNLEEIKRKDRLKNAYYQKYRYSIIRIVAYDDRSFFLGMRKICKIILDQIKDVYDREAFKYYLDYVCNRQLTILERERIGKKAESGHL
jgi:very-short-patch-repair endonuclease